MAAGIASRYKTGPRGSKRTVMLTVNATSIAYLLPVPVPVPVARCTLRPARYFAYLCSLIYLVCVYRVLYIEGQQV